MTIKSATRLMLIGLVLAGLGFAVPRDEVAPATEAAAEAVPAPAPAAAAPTDARLDRSTLEAEPQPEPAVLETQTGSASYYADSLTGRRTASGVPYRPQALVAAHRRLPFGSRLRVTNLANERVVEVVVVDRGPFARGRVLDLSRRAAEALDFVRAGHTRVRIEVLSYGD